jgi:cyclophilin family peptidyl-prolyl cis-trans isomerase
MTTAAFVTNRGSFTVQLMPEHPPTTVQDFTPVRGEHEPALHQL